MPNFFTQAEADAWGGFLSTHARISEQLAANLRHIADLSHAEYEVLLRLYASDGQRLRIQALAAQSILTHSGMSRLIDRLGAAGLIERSGADEDKRGAYAVLTTAGRELFEQTARQHSALVRKLFLSRFTPEELNVMTSFWERLQD